MTAPVLRAFLQGLVPILAFQKIFSINSLDGLLRDYDKQSNNHVLRSLALMN
jgi:hypothetical protein